MLSLALMDSRNRTLRWINLFEELLGPAVAPVPFRPEAERPLWMLGHIGWFQEAWIARNLQRDRGERCDVTLPRLMSIDPQADGLYDPAQSLPGDRWQLPLPGAQAIRQYLAETLDVTLDLLESADESDDVLYFYRLALFHEDVQCEAFATLASTLGLNTRGEEGLLRPIKSPAPLNALLYPATRWTLGAERGGFVFDNEKWAHEISVPEFEIDAQPVSWAQYAEFVEDGGYDEQRWWSEAGWKWVQAVNRRGPRHVEQLRQGVLVQREGRLMRVPMNQPVMHVSWYEAEAWCRWAGRRLPSEVEWDMAARSGSSRGFRWGDVWEWVASSLNPYPGFASSPASTSRADFGVHKVMRGASIATMGRMRSPTFRNHRPADRDEMYVGFRSCSV